MQHRRACATPGCQKPPRRRGTVCQACATRAWRQRHHYVLQARDRGRSFSPEDLALRRARGYLSVYLRRGQIARGCCEFCREPEASPAWDDPRQPLAVRWFCREHLTERRELRRDLVAEHIAARAVLETIREQLAGLPPERRAQIDTAVRVALGDRTGPAAQLAAAVLVKRLLAHEADEALPSLRI